MHQSDPNDVTLGNYFALPRLFRRRLRRSEDNGIEAHVVSVFVFIVNYLFAVQLLTPVYSSWLFFPALVGLLFGVWIFWLALLYLNWLVAKLCWRCGLFNDLPANRIQSVIFGIITSIFAAELMASGRWFRWIGIVWIAAVALNLSASLLLALKNDDAS